MKKLLITAQQDTLLSDFGKELLSVGKETSDTLRAISQMAGVTMGAAMEKKQKSWAKIENRLKEINRLPSDYNESAGDCLHIDPDDGSIYMMKGGCQIDQFTDQLKRHLSLVMDQSNSDEQIVH